MESEGGKESIINDAPKSPWAKLTQTPTKLTEIMDEQFSQELQADESDKYAMSLLYSSDDGGSDEEKEWVLPPELDLISLISSQENPDTSSDEVIANMLQLQYNKEHDSDLKKLEQKYNGTSKVSVSLSNYMASPIWLDSSDEEEEEILGKKEKDWDSFETHEKHFPAMSNRGYARVNNEVVTKHDITMSARRNACRVMESFPPCIQTGDAASFDMQISNKVYNKLKVYSKTEEQRRKRVHDKSDKATSDKAIDAKTRMMLFKLINNGVLTKVFGIISTGKEAVILFGQGGGTVELESGVVLQVPDEVAIKVFKTSLNEFKSRDIYIADDYRFKDRFSKQNPRKVIQMWAEKEMHNLNRMSRAGIPCPKVVLLKKHILILEFIGTNTRPAPKLKKVKFPTDDGGALLKSAYLQTIELMRVLYQDCNLIHGDLSEYNILWHEEKCYFIDVSQSVEPAYPNALQFLFRDCTNIVNMEGCHSPQSLFKFISGLELNQDDGPDILNQIRNFDKNVENLTFANSERSYPFETCWESENVSKTPHDSLTKDGVGDYK